MVIARSLVRLGLGTRGVGRGRRLAMAVGLAVAAVSFTGTAGAAGRPDPNPTGTWSLTDTFDNVPPDSPYRTGHDSVTFTPTAGNEYTIRIASAAGGGTSHVPISGSSFTFWECGASASGAIYSEADPAACPVSAGYYIESWRFDYAGRFYTATGKFRQYGPGGATIEGEQRGTFSATGPTNVCGGSTASESADTAEARAAESSATMASSTCPTRVVLSGTVFYHRCVERKGCRTEQPAPLEAANVRVDSPGRHYQTRSRANGTWSVKVPRGTYTVQLLLGHPRDTVEPDSRRVDAHADRSGLDFTVCRPPPDYHGPDFDCKTVAINGQVFGSDGLPYNLLGVYFDCAGERQDLTDVEGRFTVYTQPGPVTVCLLAGAADSPRVYEVAKDSLDATRDTTLRFTVPTQIFPFGVDRESVGYDIVGLPTTVSNFTVDLQRHPATDANSCASMQSQEISTSIRDPRAASDRFVPKGFIADRFCPGNYTITVTDRGTAGFDWATQRIYIK
jgi:hypothetical protein